MPVPKQKSAKSLQGRRSSHIRTRKPKMTECPQCHSPRLPHHVCLSCGYYKGREAIVIGKPELPE